MHHMQLNRCISTEFRVYRFQASPGLDPTCNIFINICLTDMFQGCSILRHICRMVDFQSIGDAKSQDSLVHSCRSPLIHDCRANLPVSDSEDHNGPQRGNDKGSASDLSEILRPQRSVGWQPPLKDVGP